MLLYHLEGAESIEKKRAYERTSYAVRQEWDRNNLKRYTVSFRLGDDADIIKYIDSHKTVGGTTALFRKAIQKLINEGQ